MNFECSPKNIPLGDKKTYMEMMIQAIEKFGRNISWRAFFKLNPNHVTNSKETFGFRSTKAAPRLKQLKDFERDFVKLMQNIKFRRRGNNFLANLNEEVKKISQEKNLIVSADKTTNNYLVPPLKYKKLLDKEIQKCYKKDSIQNVQKVELEHKKTAEDLDLAVDTNTNSSTTQRRTEDLRKRRTKDLNLSPGSIPLTA